MNKTLYRISLFLLIHSLELGQFGGKHFNKLVEKL